MTGHGYNGQDDASSYNGDPIFFTLEGFEAHHVCELHGDKRLFFFFKLIVV